MARKKPEYLLEWDGVPHLRIAHDVPNSPAWRVLDFSAKALYTDLRAKIRPTNNGNIEATLASMKHRGWNSSATLSKALQQLEHMGFIAKTRQGGIASMSKVCSLYRFTDLRVYDQPKRGVEECPATHDYRKFNTLKDAEDAMNQFQEAKKKRCKKSKVQNLKFKASESESIPLSKGSDFEQVAGS